MSPRALFWLISLGLLALVGALSLFWQPIVLAYLVLVPLFLVGIWDQIQQRHAILRNFPVAGHGRYLLEVVRPEIQQYFIESDTDGTPFNREKRSVVYQRAKSVIDTSAFGTQMDVYQPGYEWIEHSLLARDHLEEEPRVIVGGDDCKKPYSAAMLNVSAMSYGSLSDRAVMALNRGAKKGNFAHNVYPSE